MATVNDICQLVGCAVSKLQNMTKVTPLNNRQVFCWRTLRIGIYKGMLGRVHLVHWTGDESLVLCSERDFDVPFRI